MSFNIGRNRRPWSGTAQRHSCGTDLGVRVDLLVLGVLLHISEKNLGQQKDETGDHETI